MVQSKGLEKPYIILIETSLKGMALGLTTQARLLAGLAAHALGDDAQASLQKLLLWHSVDPEQGTALKSLSPMMARGLSATSVTWDRVGGAIVSIGPGSFTGMRIGLAFAYGLARGCGGFKWRGLSALQSAGDWLSHLWGTTVTLVLPSTRTHGFWSVSSPDPMLARSPAVTDITSPDDPLYCALVNHKDSGLLGKVIYLGGPEHPWFQGHYCKLLGIDATTLGHVPPNTLGEWALLGMALKVGTEEEVDAGLPVGRSLWSHELPSPLFLRLSTAEEALAKKNAPLGIAQSIGGSLS